MNELSKELIDAVKTIEDFCEYQVCHNCPFMREHGGCILMHETPNEWMDYIRLVGDDHD